MDLIIADYNDAFCEEAGKEFSGLNAIVHRGDYACSLPADVVVTPANSFGFMDGGFDLTVVRDFGAKVQETAQRVVQEQFSGQQPVGTSFLINVKHEDVKAIAHTPTMRVPSDVSKTENVYWAMWAALNAAKSGGHSAVLTPGLGCGYGKVPPALCAKLMATAFRHFSDGFDHTWESAVRINEEIRSAF